MTRARDAATNSHVTTFVHPTGAGNNHVPAGGATDQVLKYASAGTAAWGDAGGAFAATTVTVTDNTTLTAAQNGNLIRVTASSSKVISLPVTANGLFYVLSNDSTSDMYVRPNGTQTINTSPAKLVLAANSSGIISCGTAGTNWSTVGITKNMLVHKATTFWNTSNAKNSPRLTGTYTTTLGTQLLVCVGSAVAGSSYSSVGNNYRSGGAGGPSYAEKFISSPAATYAYEVCGGGSDPDTGSFDRTTKAAGMTCTRGPDSAGNSGSGGNTSGRAGGTATGGTVNFSGGSGSNANSSITGAGGGAATRAGNGGNGSSSSSNVNGGGTGGNHATQVAVGAAATARNGSTQAVPDTTSETYLAGLNGNGNGGSANLVYPMINWAGCGAGPRTEVNAGNLYFVIADDGPGYGPTDGILGLSRGGTRGANNGGATIASVGGYVTFVEFI